MSYELVVGLFVSDVIEYEQYRREMEPLLKEVGGGFGYDFEIATVLRSQTKEEINRVFTIEFPCKEVMDEFFSRKDYLAIKKRHFEEAVKSTTIISSYEKEE